MSEEIRDIIRNIQNKLTIEGKKRVFEDNKELKSEDLKQWQDPEDFTREFLIDKILYDIFNVERTGPKNFSTTDGTPRKVDYAVQYDKTKILIEAKPINANLYDKSPNAAINQIIGIFRLAEARDKFNFGIATDGLKWVFISNEGNSEEFDIRKDFNEVKKRIIGEEKILQKKMEDISKKFYEQYNDLLHGVKRISKEDCLVNSIVHVEAEEDREEIAQVVVDRLIFIKFLEAKGIIKEHVLDFLYNLEEHDLNHKLNQLFFEVMNTKEKERGSVDPHFEHIPYLNGSLFEKLDVEKRNANYRIRAKILHKVIEFLNKFKFVHHESLDGNGDFIDPEILGYIFERAMNATDRKGTGAYYTPKEITRYIAENTIYPNIIDKVNEFLIKKKGYKKSETIKNIEELFILRETTLNDVWNKIILDLSVCDNACGSGAFLLAAANVLYNLNKRINDNLGLRNSDVALKKLVLKSLYGVDINPRAIEIALLRLWLWLVESYRPENIEPLPNIEYNLRTGNSLLGYINIEQFGTSKVSLDDFLDDDETIKIMLIKYRGLKNKYVKSTGDEARAFRHQIDDIRKKIKIKLDKELFKDLTGRKIKITKEEFFELKPFHWGFEFYEIFDLDLEDKRRGFDIVLGNPPYINAIKLTKIFNKAVKDYWKKEFESAKGTYDIYVLFYEHALRICNNGGYVSFITPNKYLSAPYGFGLRELIWKNYKLFRVLDLSQIKVFEDPSVYPIISIFIKSHEKSNYKFSTEKIQNMNIEKIVSYSISSKVLSLLPNYIWGIILSNNYKLISRIFKISKPFEKVAIVQATSTAAEADNFSNFISENSEGKPIINTGTIDRYSTSYGNVRFMNKGKKMYRPVLDINKINEKRRSLYNSPKIIFAKLALRIEGFLDTEGNYSSINTNCVHSPEEDYCLKYITGLVNSKLMSFIYSELFSGLRMSGGYYQYQAPQLRTLPIIRPSKEYYQNIIDYVDEMVSLSDKLNNIKAEDKNKREQLIKKIDDIDRKIDRLVYDLYGLSKKEIKIIENVDNLKYK